MSLTDQQKEQVRYYLGYPDLETATVYQLGMPRQIKPLFILDQNLVNMLPEGETRVIDLLGQLDSSRSELTLALGRLKASKLGTIELNSAEMEQRKVYDRWLIQQLAAVVGVRPWDNLQTAVRIR